MNHSALLGLKPFRPTSVMCCDVNRLFCFSSLFCVRHGEGDTYLCHSLSVSSQLKVLEQAVQRIKTMWITGGRVPLKH